MSHPAYNKAPVPNAWRPLLEGMGLAVLWLGGTRLLHGWCGWGEAVGPLHPTGGLALALLLCRGAHARVHYGAGLALGGLCMAAWSPPADWARSAAELLAWAAEVGLGSRLLRRKGLERCSLPDGARLLGYACGCAAACGALVWASAMLAAGAWGVAEWPAQFLRWWGGSALGMVLMLPLILSWHQVRLQDVARRRVAEGLLLYGLALAAGQVIFLGWGGDGLRPLAHAYWLFLFVVWAGVRLGMAGTMGLLCLVAAQAGWGMLERQGFFAQDLQASGGLGYGAYL